MARAAPEDLAEQFEKEITKPFEHRSKKELKEENLAPSGSTMLNLACTDNPYGAYMLGGFATLPGGSTSGKTIAALTCLAECTYLERFNDYDLIHDDSEERMSFDLEYMFSKKVNDRIIAPPLGRSKTIQQFKANLLTLQKKERKTIYIIDSFDALSSDEELEKEMRKALAMAKTEEAAKKIAGSYGTEKAKITGEILRMINNYLEKSRSLVIMTQQLRQNINGGMFEPKFKTSGGEAPFYYSNHQIWLFRGKKLERKGLAVGGHTRARVVKNSATGKQRDVEFDIYYDMGIDDMTSCVDWMIENEFWKKHTIKGKMGYDAIGLDLFEPNQARLVEIIEENNLERKLIRLVAKSWKEIEDSILLNRKRKYK